MHRIVGISCRKFRYGNSSALLIGQKRNQSNRDLTPNQSDRVTRLLNGILEGNRASLSQSITLVESKNHNKEHFQQFQNQVFSLTLMHKCRISKSYQKFYENEKRDKWQKLFFINYYNLIRMKSKLIRVIELDSPVHLVLGNQHLSKIWVRILKN